MIWKFGAEALRNARRQSSSLIPRTFAAHSFSLAGGKQPQSPLRFNVVLFTMDNCRQCLITVNETARGFSATAHADPPYSYGEFSFPGIPGICTVSGSSSTSSYVVGGLSHIHPHYDSNLLFSLDSADLMPPPAPTAYGPDDLIPPPWKNLACLRNPRMNPAVVPHDGKLFIFGGCVFNQSWLEIVDTVTGRVIESRDLPDHFPDADMDPLGCFLWDGLFMVNFRDPTSRLYSYSLENDVWELFDANFPLFISDYCGPDAMRNVMPVGRDKILIIDKSDLWLVYDLPSRKKVGEVRLEGVPEDRDVLRAFICSSSDGESWIIRMFMAGEDAWRKGKIAEDLRYLFNMPYARVRVRCQGENFVAEVESLAEIAVDPYMEGTLIFPLQKFPAE